MIVMADHYTTRQVAQLLGRPEWLVRRVVDKLSSPVDRFAGKRVIPAGRLVEIAEAIRRREERREVPAQ